MEYIYSCKINIRHKKTATPPSYSPTLPFIAWSKLKPTQPEKTAKSAPFRPIVEPDVKKPTQNPQKASRNVKPM